MEMMRNYVISNGVIGHEKELGRSISEEDKQIERKILSSTDVLSRLDVREILSMI